MTGPQKQGNLLAVCKRKSNNQYSANPNTKKAKLRVENMTEFELALHRKKMADNVCFSRVWEKVRCTERWRNASPEDQNKFLEKAVLLQTWKVSNNLCNNVFAVVSDIIDTTKVSLHTITRLMLVLAVIEMNTPLLMIIFLPGRMFLGTRRLNMPSLWHKMKKRKPNFV
jgi:hypothetical protein